LTSSSGILVLRLAANTANADLILDLTFDDLTLVSRGFSLTGERRGGKLIDSSLTLDIGTMSEGREQGGGRGKVELIPTLIPAISTKIYCTFAPG
jgi:hypothetical protein